MKKTIWIAIAKFVWKMVKYALDIKTKEKQVEEETKVEEEKEQYYFSNGYKKPTTSARIGRKEKAKK